MSIYSVTEILYDTIEVTAFCLLAFFMFTYLCLDHNLILEQRLHAAYLPLKKEVISVLTLR